MTEHRMKFEVPKWLENLEKGDYTAIEISELTNATVMNVHKRMLALEVEKYLKIQENNHHANVYKWRGAAYYWKKSIQLKQQKIKEDFNANSKKSPKKKSNSHR